KISFRMLPKTFEYILSIIEPELQRKVGRTPTISPKKQFLLALWRFATPDSLRQSISDRFNVGASIALYVTRRVISAINKLAPIFRPSEVQSYLGDVSKFPDVCHLVGDQAYKEIIISFTLL
ncbi:hypothetical protein ALC53_08971, partial [Atta colombica]